MEPKQLSFPGGIILGASLMYLLDPERARSRAAPRGAGLRWIAGAIGIAAVAYGAHLLRERGRAGSSTSAAPEIDMPNYAWLR